MENLSFADIAKVAGTILILLGAYNVIMTAIKNHSEAKKLKNSPLTSISEKIAKHDVMLGNDKTRMDKLEGEVDDLGEATRILLRQALAINAHLMSGNDVSKLKDSNSEIQNYLLSRR